ncbi:MAG: TonB-dependent receptor [Bacteroidota bacterium]|nr:TonB-dependent receptor [Bacteroidota bacterium]
MKKYLTIFFLVTLQNILFGQEKDTTFILSGVEINATRKTSTSMKEPLAISVVSSKDFTKGKGYGLDEALANIPGVFAQSRYGNQDIRITIRGFGARGAGERSNSGTSRGIRILLDGFPETEPDGRTSFDLLDVSTMNKIEVVRSNSSALWGNAAGGLVSVSSNTTFDHPFVSVQTYAGSFGFQKSILQVGANIGTGKYFLNISNTNSNGWRNHSSSTQTLFSTGIVGALGEKTHIGVFLIGTTNVFHIPGPLSLSQFNANPMQAQADTSYYKPSYVERDERRFNRLGRLGISLTHSLNETNEITATTYINPKYLQRSERNTFRDFTRYHVGGSFIYRNHTEVSDKISIATTVGADEAYQDGSILFYGLKNGQRDSILADNKREGANSFGGFIQEELVLNDNIIFSLGGRHDNITYYAENYVTPTGLSDQKSFTKITPKIGVVYRITPTHSIYVSLGGGVEVPANNETDPADGQVKARSINPLLEPIVSTTYEVGTKQFLSLDHTLIKNASYDLALYLISTTNDIVPYRNGRFYLTAGETRRIGMEFGISAQFDYGFSMSAALTLSRNKYVKYTIDSVFTQNSVDLNLSGKFLSYKDNDVVGIPNSVVNIRLRNDFPFAEGLYAEVASQSIGSYFTDDANKLVVGSYTIMNAAVGYSRPIKFLDNLLLKAFISVNNITDQKYTSSAYINPDYGRVSAAKAEAIYLEPGLPQNIVGSIGLSYNF